MSAAQEPAGRRFAHANLGAEEGDSETPRTFPAGSAPARLAAQFAAVVAAPPWAFLRDASGLVPWLVTPAAERVAQRRGLAVFGAPAAVVYAVHDKAFAAGVAAREPLRDALLAPLVHVLEPAQLEVGHIEAHVATWPSWAQASFTLKPRQGTSGRGRLIGRAGRLPTSAAGAMTRFQQQGGAVLEPWLQRSLDLSSQWYVPAAREPVLLGSTRAQLTPAGVYQGCTVVRTPQGALVADTVHDACLHAHAGDAVRAVQAAGFMGVCGVDAFVWQAPDGSTRLRSVVEVNARFTAGTIALALAHAALVGPGTFTYLLASEPREPS